MHRLVTHSHDKVAADDFDLALNRDFIIVRTSPIHVRNRFRPVAFPPGFLRPSEISGWVLTRGDARIAYWLCQRLLAASPLCNDRAFGARSPAAVAPSRRSLRYTVPLPVVAALLRRCCHCCYDVSVTDHIRRWLDNTRITAKDETNAKRSICVTFISFHFILHVWTAVFETSR